MSVGIVYILEVVQVDHQYRKCSSITLARGKFREKLLVEFHPVADPGQMVEPRGVLEILVILVDYPDADYQRQDRCYETNQDCPYKHYPHNLEGNTLILFHDDVPFDIRNIPGGQKHLSTLPIVGGIKGVLF